MSSPPADRSGSGGLLTQTISPSMTASLAALFPAVLFAVTYLMAAANGHVAWCLPPVGSCTDLVATVVRPLVQFYGDRFELAPLTVLLDRGREQEGFSDDVHYLYRQQPAFDASGLSAELFTTRSRATRSSLGSATRPVRWSSTMP